MSSSMISLYQASVPMMIKSCHNLRQILTKAEQHCTSKSLDPKEVIQYRLIADMRPLAYQVQSASDTVKFMAVRVGGMTDYVIEDNEETFEQLQDRVTKTLDILKSLKSDCMDGDVNREVLMNTRAMGTFKLSAFDYVLKYAIPNFHFHLTSAYCLLRVQGVPVNAFDYLDTQRELFVKA